MSEFKQKVVKGFTWAFLERLSIQFAGFFISMVLARLLTPSDFGTVALLTIFLSLSMVLADSGFGQALIQKKNATETDFNSVFYLSICLSFVVYGVLFLCAPWIAAFYDDPRLIPIFRVLSITVVLNAVNSIQNAELNRKLLFHLSFRIGILTSLTTAVVGVPLAYLGFGPWALVWSAVAGAFVGVLARWFLISWRPGRLFSWRALRDLFHFGWKMTLSSLLDAAYDNFYGLLIGKLYSRTDLAFVDKGQVVPKIATDTINSTLGTVAFPVLARIQDKLFQVRESMRRMISCSTFFVFPIMAGCAICAPDLIDLVYGDQWMPAVPYVRLACFSFALRPLDTINLKGLVAIGHSEVFLKLELIKKTIGFVAMFLAIPYGVWWMMAVGAFVIGPLGLFINSWPTGRLLKYTFFMQLRDVGQNLVITMLMSVIVYGLSFFSENLIVRLLFQVGLGGSVYFFLSWLVRARSLVEFARILYPVCCRKAPSCLRPFCNVFFSRLIVGKER